MLAFMNLAKRGIAKWVSGAFYIFGIVQHSMALQASVLYNIALSEFLYK